MTLTRRIIPCLDVKDGRVVKGTRFESIRDAGDPVELAARYGEQGADELVFLDITASAERRKTIDNLVQSVASVIDIPFTVGGGVASVDDARNILLHGADKVGINTGAVENPGVISELAGLFGRQCVVVAIDAKRNRGARPLDSEGSGDSRFEVFTYGGRQPTGMDAIKWARTAESLGAGEILLTSMDRDGTNGGYDTELCDAVSESVSIPVIASGGCGSPGDMADIFAKTSVGAALAASIFHYSRHGVAGVKRHLADAGVPVRL